MRHTTERTLHDSQIIIKLMLWPFCGALVDFLGASWRHEHCVVAGKMKSSGSQPASRSTIFWGYSPPFC